MPLPSDEKLVALGENLLKQFDSIFGLHPGFRPAHAKGLLLTGTFTPTREASSLTRAPQASRESTPVTVRFSDSTGLPMIADNDPNANPHGMAIRFHLAERVHTDIISHSKDGFPVHTGDDFLEMLRAVAATRSMNPAPSPSPIELFLQAHPAALAFVQPAPSPSSFAREAYFAVSAFRFTNKDGVSRYGRYRITPDAGVEYLDGAAAEDQSTDYLFDDLRSRVSAGPIGFNIAVQLANESDVVDDATIHWQEDRALFQFGKLSLTDLAPEEVHAQQTIIFDPIPRVDGIEPSDDPLFGVRAAIYLLSGRRRRQAPANSAG